MTNTINPLEAQEILRETLITQATKITNSYGISVVQTTFKQAFVYPTNKGNIIGFPVNFKREIKPFKEV